MYHAHGRIQTWPGGDRKFNLAEAIRSPDAAYRRSLREDLAPRRDPFASLPDLMAFPSPWNEDGLPIGSEHGNIPWDNAANEAKPLSRDPYDGMTAVKLDAEASRWITAPSDIASPGSDTRLASANRSAIESMDRVSLSALDAVDAAVAAKLALIKEQSRNDADKRDLDKKIKAAERASKAAVKAHDRAAALTAKRQLAKLRSLRAAL